MSSALIFIAGGIMKPYITGVILGIASFKGYMYEVTIIWK